MKAGFNGSLSGFDSWAVDSNWAGGTAPTSSPGLHVQLNSDLVETMGSATKPFLTNDIIGADVG